MLMVGDVGGRAGVAGTCAVAGGRQAGAAAGGRVRRAGRLIHSRRAGGPADRQLAAGGRKRARAAGGRRTIKKVLKKLEQILVPLLRLKKIPLICALKVQY